jgi:hypothetical protein
MSAVDVIELSMRAVACKRWRWMPGMLTLETPSDRPFRIANAEWPYLTARSDSLPDLTDPATVGCLLAIVNETSVLEVKTMIAALDGMP